MGCVEVEEECGAVWCCVVWCGAVWCGVVWCHSVLSALSQHYTHRILVFDRHDGIIERINYSSVF
jgi:hypothetical protein